MASLGRISKEVEGDGENHPGGCPSKLSPHDKQSIISQITYFDLLRNEF